ncbi:ASCH domain-containing protein [Pseudogracilibacillus sp. ICA-222130]|uniref:ASCH domain-containing protein n=1 Tax=Pseudogracilibacillus sp. ICA-222130 TaxID=3134655 RepID=UPI0030BB895F
MNEKAKDFWLDYWSGKGEVAPTNVTAWQFGVDADDLAQLVVDGIKTATCSGHIFYELEKEPLPKVGDYSIILNGVNEPEAIIRLTEVTVTPMNEVTEQFAYDEGEGDRSYAYWWKEHEAFFTKELKGYGLPFQEDMLVVCERFELIAK